MGGQVSPNLNFVRKTPHYWMEFHRIMQYLLELQIIAWIYIELNRNTKNVTKYAENAKQLKGTKY